LLHSANEAGAPLSIVQAANEVNYKQSNRFFELISKRFNNNLAGKRFAVWGLAFKPNTDDVREAPAFRIIDKLLENGAEVNAYDPQAIDNTKKVYGNKINYATSKYEALNSADALLIITEWNTFRNPDFDEIKSALSEPVIFDGRNLFDLEEMSNMEFEYYSIGRKYVNSKINIQ